MGLFRLLEIYIGLLFWYQMSSTVVVHYVTIGRFDITFVDGITQGDRCNWKFDDAKSYVDEWNLDSTNCSTLSGNVSKNCIGHIYRIYCICNDIGLVRITRLAVLDQKGISDLNGVLEVFSHTTTVDLVCNINEGPHSAYIWSKEDGKPINEIWSNNIGITVQNNSWSLNKLSLTYRHTSDHSPDRFVTVRCQPVGSEAESRTIRLFMMKSETIAVTVDEDLPSSRCILSAKTTILSCDGLMEYHTKDCYWYTIDDQETDAGYSPELRLSGDNETGNFRCKCRFNNEMYVLLEVLVEPRNESRRLRPTMFCKYEHLDQVTATNQSSKVEMANSGRGIQMHVILIPVFCSTFPILAGIMIYVFRVRRIRREEAGSTEENTSMSS